MGALPRSVATVRSWGLRCATGWVLPLHWVGSWPKFRDHISKSVGFATFGLGPRLNLGTVAQPR